ncbi:MAG: T9SS type A sorting domain-containing protein [Chlorobi bacterium]|nr:T9SS type A sorting domain-containing protein [Chlorobiota bacterium]
MKTNPTCFILLILFSFTTSLSFSQMIWSKTFGGVNNDEGAVVRQTSDGGFIVSGVTDLLGNNVYNLWLIKTDAAGNEEWSKTYDLNAGDVRQTPDNGYIVATSKFKPASGDYDVVLMKTNSTGDTLWTKTYGGSGDEGASRVLLTADGGYAITGTTRSFGAGNTDFMLIKTNSTGEMLWMETYGGSYNDLCFEGQETADGGFILAGYKQMDAFENADFYLVKTDAGGNEQWNKNFGGDQDDLAYSVAQTSDDGYILTGYTRSFGSGFYSLYLVKTDESGDSVWTKVYGGDVSDFGMSVIQTPEDDFAISGLTQSYSEDGVPDIWLLKTDVYGDILWTDHLGGSSAEQGSFIDQTTSGDFIITGFTYSYGAGESDLWLVRYASDGPTGIENREQSDGPAVEILGNFPNPFSSATTITYAVRQSARVTMSIYDITQREVARIVNDHKLPGTYKTVFDGSRLESGIYFCHLRTDNQEVVKKIVIAR